MKIYDKNENLFSVWIWKAFIYLFMYEQHTSSGPKKMTVCHWHPLWGQMTPTDTYSRWLHFISTSVRLAVNQHVQYIITKCSNANIAIISRYTASYWKKKKNASRVTILFSHSPKHIVETKQTAMRLFSFPRQLFLMYRCLGVDLVEK